MVKVYAARGYDIQNDVNVVGRAKYTREAMARFGLEEVPGSEQEVEDAALDAEGRFYVT